MDWYCIHFSPEQIEFGFVDILKAELEEVWIARGGPHEFSVWLELISGGTRIYLSPTAAGAASTLVLKFGGTACEPPQTDTMSFLLGYGEEHS